MNTCRLYGLQYILMLEFILKNLYAGLKFLFCHIFFYNAPYCGDDKQAYENQQNRAD